MEEVFDLRQFVLMLWKKGKVFLICALIFALLGGIFGYITGKDDSFVSTASASVNTTNTQTDATALTSIMTSIKESISSDFFYTGILTQMSKEMEKDDIETLFGTKKQPTIARLKEVVTVYVKGNLVLVDVKGDQELTIKASAIARKFVINRLEQNINDIDIVERDQQTVASSLKTGASQKKDAIKFAVLGFAGGLVICAIFVFLFDVMSISVKTEDDLKKYNLPVFTYNTDTQRSVINKLTLSMLAALSAKVPKPYSIAICISNEVANKAELVILSRDICSSCGQNGLSAAVCESVPLNFKEAVEYRDKCEEKSDVSIYPLHNIDEEAAMISCCDAVLLCESDATSRLDKIENALVAIDNARKIPLGFAFLKKSSNARR